MIDFEIIDKKIIDLGKIKRGMKMKNFNTAG